MVISAMLRTAPQRRRKSTAHSGTSDQPPDIDPPGTPSRARAVASPIGEAYGRFLELPVPVVLLALWLFGAMVLGLLLGAVLLAVVSLA